MLYKVQITFESMQNHLDYLNLIACDVNYDLVLKQQHFLNIWQYLVSNIAASPGLRLIKLLHPERKTVCEQKPYLVPFSISQSPRHLLTCNYNRKEICNQWLETLKSCVLPYGETPNLRRFLKKRKPPLHRGFLDEFIGGRNLDDVLQTYPLARYDDKVWWIGYGIAVPISLVGFVYLLGKQLENIDDKIEYGYLLRKSNHNTLSKVWQYMNDELLDYNARILVMLEKAPSLKYI